MRNARSRMIATVVVLAWLSFAATPTARAEDTLYHLTKTIHLDGDASWDYLTADSAARRLYVTHYDHVMVLDIDSGEPVGKIPALEGVHGVAVAPEYGRGFASNGKADSITVFDLESLAVTGRLPAGDNPDAIIFDPASRRVFAFNHSDGSVTVIEAVDGTIAGTVEVGGELEYAVADGQGSIFVNVEDRSEVVKIDRSLEVADRWPLAPCKQPTGLAIDPVNRRLFSACHNAVLVIIDADDGEVLASMPIGHGCDGVRFEPETGLIFTSNGEGSLSIIHEDTADAYHLVGSVATRRGARTLELDLPTHKIFTATATIGPVHAEKSGESLRPPILPGSLVVLEYSR